MLISRTLGAERNSIGNMQSSPALSTDTHARTVQHLRDRFRSLDSNADGKLSEAELTTLLADSGMDAAAAAKRAAALFAQCTTEAAAATASLDSISSAPSTVPGVTYAAFLSEYVRMSRFKALKAIQAKFNAMDTNGDGVLSKDELRSSLVRQIGESAADDQLDSVFAAMDSNKDGSVDLHEFWAFIRLKSVAQTEEQ